MSAVPPEPDRQSTDWAAITALFLAGLGAAGQLAKVPPTADLLAHDLNLLAISLAVSGVGLVGVVCGVAASGVVRALGERRLLLIAMTSAAVVAGLGSLVQSAADLLVLRFLEGATHLIIVVAIPSLMIVYAKRKDRPLALALWASVFSAAFAVTNFIGPAMINAAGWRGFYLAHAAYMAAATLLLSLLIKSICDPGAVPKKLSLRRLIDDHRTIYTSGPLLLLAIVLGCYALQFITYITFLTIYFADVLSMSAKDVGNWIGILSLVTLVANIAAGALLRSGGEPFSLLMVSFVLSAFCAVGIFVLQCPPAADLALSIVMLAMSGLVPGLVFALIPVVANRPELVTLTTGAVAQMGSIGIVSGPPLFAAAASSGGWSGGGILLAACCACGVLITAIIAAMSRPARMGKSAVAG